VFLRQQPGQRDLRRRRLLSLGEQLQPRNERQVRFPVLLVNRGTTLRKSVGSNVVFSSIVPVRKPLPRG